MSHMWLVSRPSHSQLWALQGGCGSQFCDRLPGLFLVPGSPEVWALNFLEGFAPPPSHPQGQVPQKGTERSQGQ